MRKKPTGKNPVVLMGVTESGITQQFLHNNEETRKEEIEKRVIEAWIGAAGINLRVEQNPENDNDFRGYSKRGKHSKTEDKVTVELVELVLDEYPPPFEKLDKENYKIDPLKYVQSALNLITKKDAHYVKSGRKLWLVVYVTHWAYLPNDSIISKLRIEINRSKLHSLSRVYFYVYSEHGPKLSWRIFPHTRRKDVRLDTYFNLNPMAWKSDPSD